MQQPRPTRTYRLPADVAERADEVAVDLTARERRLVDRGETLRRAVDIGLRALANPNATA